MAVMTPTIGTIRLHPTFLKRKTGNLTGRFWKNGC